MNKLNSYTKYQKNVIKFLGTLLDNERPFFYEKTKSNHLKVKIQGVDTVLYTGGTPSDVKSLSNFKAEVKRAIKAGNNALNEPVSAPIQEKNHVISPIQSSERLVSSIIKQFRSSRDAMIQKEKNMIQEEQSLDCIKAFRFKTINNMVLRTHKQQKNNVYLKGKALKAITEKLSVHAEFILPTLGYYKDLLKEYKKIKLDQNHNLAITQPTKLPNKNVDKLVPILRRDPVLKMDSFKESQGLIETEEPKVKRHDIKDFMTNKEKSRLNALRQLSKSESLILIDEINQAISLNQEESIKEVLTFIEDKEIPHELLAQYLKKEHAEAA